MALAALEALDVLDDLEGGIVNMQRAGNELPCTEVGMVLNRA